MPTYRPLTIGIDASRAFVNEPAGPEYYSLNLIKNIAKIDNFNNYKLYVRDRQRPTFELPRNFELVQIRLPRLWTQLGLAYETIVRPPDVLFVPAHTLPLLTKVLLPHVPILVTIHGLEGKFLPQSGNPLAHFYRNWSIEWAIRFSDRLIAVSDDTKQDVVSTYKTNPNKIQVIHEGVDLTHFDTFSHSNTKSRTRSVLTKYGIDKDYILFVGTVQPRKNLVRLIESFSSVNGRFQNILLVIAGKLGWMYKDILASPGQYGVEKRVKFIGRVEDSDLPVLYREAKLFVLPSLTEGFGLPILEAQASSVPVLASWTGAIPEIAGKGAFYVNPLSIEEISQGIKKILGSSMLRQELVRKGLENGAMYSWERTADSTMKMLIDMAGGKH